MFLSRKSVLVAAFAAAGLWGASAQATVLTYHATISEIPNDASTVDGGTFDDYGDNVGDAFTTTSGSDFLQTSHNGNSVPSGRKYQYGTAGGATPNVVVSNLQIGAGVNGGRFYHALDVTPNLQTTVVGVNYIWDNETSAIILKADAGFQVTLNSFVLGATQAGQNVDVFRIFLNDTGAWLPAYNNPGQAVSTVVGGDLYNSSNFGVLTAQNIRIELSKAGAGAPWEIAIDNINFSQSAVPEPASLALLGAGGLLILGRRRRA